MIVNVSDTSLANKPAQLTKMRDFLIESSVLGRAASLRQHLDHNLFKAGFLDFRASSNHFLGLKANGSIVALGRNTSGECNVPAPNTGFVAIAASGYHSLGLKADGSIAAWGSNVYGQCNVPPPNTGFVAITAGGYAHSLGLKSDGSIVAWGRNGWGQCNVPAPNTDFVAIYAANYASCGIKNNDDVVVWGYGF